MSKPPANFKVEPGGLSREHGEDKEGSRGQRSKRIKERELLGMKEEKCPEWNQKRSDHP